MLSRDLRGKLSTRLWVVEGANMPPKERIVAGEPNHTSLARLSRRLQRLVEKQAKQREAGLAPSGWR